MSSNVDSMASQARVANAASRRSCLAALADPDLVDVAIEPGSVTDAAGGSFRLAACFLRMRCISCAWHFTAVALADTGRRLEN